MADDWPTHTHSVLKEKKMGEKLQLIKGVIFGKAEDDFPSTLLFFFFLDKLSFQAQTHISLNHARIMKV